MEIVPQHLAVVKVVLYVDAHVYVDVDDDAFQFANTEGVQDYQHLPVHFYLAKPRIYYPILA